MFKSSLIKGKLFIMVGKFERKFAGNSAYRNAEFYFSLIWACRIICAAAHLWASRIILRRDAVNLQRRIIYPFFRRISVALDYFRPRQMESVRPAA